MTKKLTKYVIPTLAATIIGGVSTTPIISANASELLTAEESKEIALEKIRGIVEEVELENEDGILIYEVEVRAEDGLEHEVIIDAQTGEIVAVELDDNDDDDDSYDDDDDEDDGDED